MCVFHVRMCLRVFVCVRAYLLNGCDCIYVTMSMSVYCMYICDVVYVCVLLCICVYARRVIIFIILSLSSADVVNFYAGTLAEGLNDSSVFVTASYFPLKAVAVFEELNKAVKTGDNKKITDQSLFVNRFVTRWTKNQVIDNVRRIIIPVNIRRSKHFLVLVVQLYAEPHFKVPYIYINVFKCI